ncbi:MAG: winged helix-turn-helix domain-containing protein [Haloechinothrix sp.]
MTVPKFYEFILPLLRQLADGEPRHWRPLRDGCVREFQLADADLAEHLPSGQSRVDNRVLWANSYLLQAGLVDRPRRGTLQINERGRSVLKDPPDVITPDYLLTFPEFREFKDRTRGQQDTQPVGTAASASAEAETPLENISDAVAEATSALQSELLKRVIAEPPEFLERLAVKLLNRMGYGDEAGNEHRGRPGDGGIDGAIRQDALGLNTIYMP